MIQKKVLLVSKDRIWNEKRRYNVNDVVSFDGKSYQNISGNNSIPSDLLDWIVFDGLKAGDNVSELVNDGDGTSPYATLNDIPDIDLSNLIQKTGFDNQSIEGNLNFEEGSAKFNSTESKIEVSPTDVKYGNNGHELTIISSVLNGNYEQTYQSKKGIIALLGDISSAVSGIVGGFQGSANTTTIPTGSGFYIPEESGVYAGFGGAEVDLSEGMTILIFDGVNFTKQVIPIDLTTVKNFKGGVNELADAEDVKVLNEKLLNNIFDKSKVIDGYVVNGDNGSIEFIGDGYKYSGFQKINENKVLIFKKLDFSSGLNFRIIWFYDELGNAISSVTVNANDFTKNVPEDAYYFAFTNNAIELINDDLNLIEVIVYPDFDFLFNKNEYDKLDSLIIGEVNNVVFNSMLLGLIIPDGEYTNEPSWKVTDFLPINFNDILKYTVRTAPGNDTFFLYDENKVFLRGMDYNPSVASTKIGDFVNIFENVKYVRVHTLNTSHPNYIDIDFNVEIETVSGYQNLSENVSKNTSAIENIREIDLEKELEDLLISKEEHISKIEKGDFGIIVNGNDFKVGTQTKRLKDAIAFIKKCGKGVLELSSDEVSSSDTWLISEALLMPSNFTLLIRSGVTLKKEDGVFDNVLRNDGIVPNESLPYGKVDELNENRNIHIVLENGAFIKDLTNPRFAPHPINGGANVLYQGDAFGWRTIMLLFANCKNYSVKGGSFEDGKCWSISNESGCENFVYDGINFQTYLINGDGIDVRPGCKNFIIKNITGSTVDDTVALTCLVNENEFSLPMQVGGYKYIENNIYKPEIENGLVYNIRSNFATHALIILVAGTGAKINNISVSKIEQMTGSFTPIHAVLDVFTGYFLPFAEMGQMENIYINDVYNKTCPDGAIKLDVPIQKSHFNLLKNDNISTDSITYGEYFEEGNDFFVTNY